MDLCHHGENKKAGAIGFSGRHPCCRKTQVYNVMFKVQWSLVKIAILLDFGLIGRGRRVIRMVGPCKYL